MPLSLSKNSRIDAFHAQTHEPNDNAYPFLSSMFHSLLPFCAHRQTGWKRGEKEERKEVSKKEKKAGAVNDAMPKAPRLSFGSVLSVCKAKAQVERRTDRQMNSSSVSGISLPPVRVRATARPCDRPTRAPHSLYGD